MQIGIVGFGAIGQAVAAGLENDGAPDAELAAIWTGVLTAMSVLAAIRKLTSPLRVGS